MAEYEYNGGHIICLLLGEPVRDTQWRHKWLADLIRDVMRSNKPTPWWGCQFWVPHERYLRERRFVNR